MSKNLLPDDPGVHDRFWYWRGASGQYFIHSIYTVRACPPLPGAVYVVVRCQNGERSPIAVGRFPSTIDGWSDDGQSKIEAGDEVHVHLLARDDEGADRILRDLVQAHEQPAVSIRLSSVRRDCAPQLDLIAA